MHWLSTVLLTPVVYGVYKVSVFMWGFLRRARELSKLPSPPRSLIWGHLKEHPGFSYKLLDYFIARVQQYPRAYVWYTGPFRQCVVATHPDTVKQFTNLATSKTTGSIGGYSFLMPWLGNGLITTGVSDGRWFRNRRLLTPAFHFDVLKSYISVFNESAEKLMNKFEGHSKDSVEIMAPISLCTLDVIMRCAMSYEQDVQKHGENHPYVSNLYRIMELVLQRAINLFVYPETLYKLTKDGQEFFRRCDEVHKVGMEVIRQRQADLQSSGGAVGSHIKGKRYLDFLDILLSARDEDGNGLTTQEIREEVDTFMFAGHDTTASALSWILYSLAKHPEHQQECRDEVERLMAGRGDKRLIWEDMQALPYMTLCIKEALRLHSPVVFINRQLDAPMDFEGVHLEKDIVVDINIYMIHHNPAVWGDDHMEYIPARFEADNMKDVPPHAFIPFSAGPRNCIGQNFAMNELKVMTASILQRFVMSVDESNPVIYKPSIVMRAEHGIKLFFESR